MDDTAIGLFNCSSVTEPRNFFTRKDCFRDFQWLTVMSVWSPDQWNPQMRFAVAIRLWRNRDISTPRLACSKYNRGARMINNSTYSGQTKGYLNQSPVYALLVGWKSYNKTWRFTETLILPKLSSGRLTRMARMGFAGDRTEELNPTRDSSCSEFSALFNHSYGRHDSPKRNQDFPRAYFYRTVNPLTIIDFVPILSWS